MDKEYVLNRERKGLRIRVKSSFSGLQIKESFEKVEKIGAYTYIPGGITKEADGYGLHIRGKISVKDYLKSEKIDKNLICNLLYSLQELWRLSAQSNLSFYNFLFDYDAIFMDSPDSNMEFIYLPGAKLNKYNNSVRDMLMILLIQCSSDNSEVFDCIENAVEKIGIWEETEEPFPGFVTEIVPKVKMFREWKNFVIAVGCSSVVAIAFWIVSDSLIIWLLWLISSVAAVLLTAPVKLEFLQIYKFCYLKDGPGMDKEEITVGRDEKWADYYIDNLIISRRHAVIIQNGESLFVRDLFSTNGTYVDGKRLASGEEVEVFPKQTICFGGEYNYSVTLKRKIIFKKL
ncbi:MAG: FHA domain-containing protein [Ruminococcaceae bacterium]|nr:FHA domain-containing protein [Oscillospiraceae bacterium]